MEINLKTVILAIALVTGLPSVSISVTADQNREWRTLLHFRQSFLTSEKSEVDDSDFFLSSDGRNDALAELEATLVALRKPRDFRIGRYDLHPQCVFPARTRFLRRYYDLPVIDCPELENWKRQLQTKSIAIVYAAPYLGNPASTFGHTFLRLNSGRELVDASVSFDAVTSGDHGVTYAWKGLTGGYEGVFSVQPYYQKLKAYSEIENRALWEFELPLSQEQVEYLTEHLWELGAARSRYFFVGENCSYHLLSLLEAIEPRWNLRSQFHAMTLPLDTIRALDRQASAQGVFWTSVRFRPALLDRLMNRLRLLTTEERREFDLVRVSHVVTGHESAAVLDALLDWQTHQTANRTDGGNPFGVELEGHLLLARAQMASRLSPEPGSESTEYPQDGHRSSKISLSIANENGWRALGLQWRPVVHDIYEPSLGYAPYSSLVIGQIDIQYFPERGDVSLQEVTLAEVVNLQPYSQLWSRFSWRAAAKIFRPYDLSCFDCAAGDVTAGIGLSGAYGALLASALVNGTVQFSNEFMPKSDSRFRYGPSATGRLLWNWRSQVLAGGEVNHAVLFSGFDRSPRVLTEIGITIAVPFRGLESEARLNFARRFISDVASDVARFSLARYF